MFICSNNVGIFCCQNVFLFLPFYEVFFFLVCYEVLVETNDIVIICQSTIIWSRFFRWSFDLITSSLFPWIYKKGWIVCNGVHCVLCCIAEWDPWGVPDDYECEVIENDAPVPKHVPLHRPGPLPEEFYKTLQGISSDQTKLDEAKATSIDSESKA